MHTFKISFFVFRIAFKYINLSLANLKRRKEEDTDLTLLQSMLMTKGLDISGAMVTVADMLMAGIDTVMSHAKIHFKLHFVMTKFISQI